MNEEQKQSLKILVRAYFDYQRERINLDGRLGQKKNEKLKKGIPYRDPVLLILLKSRRDQCIEMETNLQKEIAKEVHLLPLWKQFAKDTKGLGEILTAILVTEFDINIATNVSKMWQFAGLNPGMVYGKKVKKDGTIIITDTLIRGDRKTSGFRCPYNQFLKAKLCGILGPSFLKCGSPYSKFYYDERHRLESMDWGIASKNPVDKNKPKAGHQHRTANRKMVKFFLQDLYDAWRTIEGLSVREPYAVEYLEKKHEEVTA